jgi:hydrogenase expression/formation protein HypE
MAILVQREGLGFETNLSSDTAPLNHMVERMLSTSKDIHVLRDPTRGGLGTTLNEVARSSRVGIKIYEERIPVRNEVSAVCELLGFDPLYVANEGKLIAFVAEESIDDVLAVAKKDGSGKNAIVIGEVLEDHPTRVIMETRSGGSRIVDMLTGEQLPRIC